MWSGDTGSDFGSLAAQMPNQTHMMWSGLDYYGSDVGGFHRGALGIYPGYRDDAMDELYTQWLAYSAMFEVPVRPHTENLCNCKETAPDRIGDVASNRANLALRYALAPYYYSLAYAAWRDGEPVFPSVDYWFPEAAEARELGHEKMIGSELLSAARRGVWRGGGRGLSPRGRLVRLPHRRDGDLDWRDLDDSRSTTAGCFQLPLFARDGAIVPIEGGVLNVFGSAPNVFEWYDDDGVSTAYRSGDFDLIRVFVDGNRLMIQRGAGFGIAPKTLRWTRPDFTPVGSVTINGTEVSFTQADGLSLDRPADVQRPACRRSALGGFAGDR